MAYMKINWENYPSQATPIDEDNLNHMEDGIEEAVTGLDLKVDKTDYDAFIEQLLPVDTESGNPAVITDAFGGAVKALSVSFEPIQSGSGTPSPQNIRPISGRTQAEIINDGENIIAEPSFKNGYYLDNSGAEQTNSAYKYTQTYFSVDALTDYRFTFDKNSIGETAVSVCMYDSNKTFISRTLIIQPTAESGKISTVFQCVANTKFIRFSCAVESTGHQIQKEFSSITISFGQTVYGGVLDVTSGVLTNASNLATYASSDVSLYSDNYANVRYAQVLKRTNSADYNKYLTKIQCCSNFVVSDIPTGQIDSASNIGKIAGNSDVLYYWIGFPKNVTLAEAQSAINDMQICYELATPTTVQLTAEEVTLLKGDNVLTTNGSDISVSYSADVQAYIDKKVAEGSSSRSVDTSSLTKSGSTESTEEVTKTVESEEK